MTQQKAKSAGKTIVTAALLFLGAFAAVMAMIFLLIVLTLRPLINDNKPLEFTAQAWQSQSGERYRMVESLEKQYDFAGMTCDEFMEILGQDDWEEQPCPAPTAAVGWTDGYYVHFYLGSHGIFVDEFMRVYFSDDDLFRMIEYFNIKD